MRLNKFLSIEHRNGLKWMMTAATLIAASAVFSSNAQAGELRKAKQEVRSVYLVKYRVNSDVRYAKNPGRKVIKISASQYRTSNSYICTPSGFGQKARCYVPRIFKRPNV
jgi:hypothetical protein